MAWGQHFTAPKSYGKRHVGPVPCRDTAGTVLLQTLNTTAQQTWKWILKFPNFTFATWEHTLKKPSNLNIYTSKCKPEHLKVVEVWTVDVVRWEWTSVHYFISLLFVQPGICVCMCVWEKVGGVFCILISFPLCRHNRTAAPYLSSQVIQRILRLVLCRRIIISSKKKKKGCLWLAAATDWPNLKSIALFINRTSCSGVLRQDRGPLIGLLTKT